MRGKLRRPSPAMVVACLALAISLGPAAYAANTVFSTDIVDGEVKNPDLADGAVSNHKLSVNSVGTAKVIDGTLLGSDISDGSLGNADLGTDSVSTDKVLNSSLTGADVASSSLTGADVASDSLTGADISESSLSVPAMGCQIGKVQAFARVKGDSGMPTIYTSASDEIDTKSNCAGGAIEVRRSSTGVYFVRFGGLAAKLAVAISNSDGFGVNSTANDNLLSINRITGGSDIGAFRVEIEDINGSGTDPEDNWFTIIVV